MDWLVIEEMAASKTCLCCANKQLGTWKIVKINAWASKGKFLWGYDVEKLFYNSQTDDVVLGTYSTNVILVRK